MVRALEVDSHHRALVVISYGRFEAVVARIVSSAAGFVVLFMGNRSFVGEKANMRLRRFRFCAVSGAPGFERGASTVHLTVEV